MENNIEKWFLITNHPIDLRPRIRNDIQANLNNFPLLRLTSTTYTDKNIANKVLALEGQILVNYNNTQYGVPIICILSIRYPFTAPFLYIKNPPNTSLQPSIYMTSEGLVTHPILNNWDSKKSSLSAVLREVPKAFEQHFPIVSGIQHPTPRPDNLYPDLAHPQAAPQSEPHKHFRLDKRNPTHSTYFELEEQEKWLEQSIHESCLYLHVNPQEVNSVTLDLKRKYHEMFILNRKKDKCILLLSKLG